jgi:hypothetical protein
MLVKPYRHALLAGAVRELDRDTAKIVASLHGKMTGRDTTTVAGHDARTYTISYDSRVQELTFVLDGSREYELICRRAGTDDEAPCGALRETFTIG